MNVAICDDSFFFVEITEAYLRQYEVDHGCIFTILSFESGEDLIAWLDVARIPIDLVFLDYNMKELDGLETAKRIRMREGNDSRNCQIVFVTSIDPLQTFEAVSPLCVVPKPLNQITLNSIMDYMITLNPRA